MGRLLSILLALFSFSLTAVAQEPLPPKVYQVEGEAITIYTKLNKSQLDQKKVIQNIKRVRKEFLKFMNSGDNEYALPESSKIDIYVIARDVDWKNF